jgi:hypothetical protein
MSTTTETVVLDDACRGMRVWVLDENAGGNDPFKKFRDESCIVHMATLEYVVLRGGSCFNVRVGVPSADRSRAAGEIDDAGSRVSSLYLCFRLAYDPLLIGRY